MRGDQTNKRVKLINPVHGKGSDVHKPIIGTYGVRNLRVNDLLLKEKK